MTNDEIATVVLREISQAIGYESDTLSAQRKKALDYYNGIMPAPAQGRSAVVSLDVSDAIHALLAQIVPVIKTSQIEFDARSQEDELQARSETDFVQIEIERAKGYVAIGSACHDALLLCNAWLEVEPVDVVTSHEVKYPPGLGEPELMAIAQQLPRDTEATMKPGSDATVVRYTTTKKRLSILSVAPEEMLFSEDGSTYELEDVRFVARRCLYSAATLRDLGIAQAKIDAIPDAMPSTTSSARAGSLVNEVNTPAVQSANSLKEIYRCFYRLQTGEKNAVELREIWVGGNQLLLNRAAAGVPWITGSAIPVPHRIQGSSVFNLLEQVQAGKTGILRAYMDNLSVMNASRLWADPERVNMTDLASGRINGFIRASGADALGQLPATDIGQQAMAGLGYLDQVRAARVGASLDFNEVQSQLMASSATAAAGQLAKVEQMSGWFAGNLVRGLLLPLFLRVHSLMRGEMAGIVQAKIGGKWQTTDTGEWQERTVTSIQMGMTTTEKAERMAALQAVIQQQQGLLAAGARGILTDDSRLFNAMGDWIRSANLGSPDQYLIDPASAQAQQAAQNAAQQQAASVQNAAAAQVEIAVKSQAPLLEMQHHYKRLEQERDLAYKVWSDKLDAEIKDAQMAHDGAVQMKKLYASMPKEKPDTEDVPEDVKEGSEND